MPQRFSRGRRESSDDRKCSASLAAEQGMVRPGSIEGLGLRVRSYRTEPVMSAFGTLPQHDNLSGHTVATTLSGSGRSVAANWGGVLTELRQPQELLTLINSFRLAFPIV